MRRVPITDFAAKHGQARASELLGCTQGALSKALSHGRVIFVIRHRDGSYQAEEVRPFPSQKKKDYE